MAEQPKKYTNDSLTQEQADEIFQTGSISILTMAQRSSYLYWFAKRFDLDPYTKPFDLIPDKQGKLFVYTNKSATDQLRKKHNLDDEILYKGPLVLGDKVREDVYMVHVLIKDPQGRKTENFGCIGMDGLTGDALANAIMKCITKAKRRATLDHCGLSMPDESELNSAWVTVVEPTVEASAIEIPRVGPGNTLPALPAAQPTVASFNVPAPAREAVPVATALPKASALPKAPKILDGPKPLPAATPPTKV